MTTFDSISSLLCVPTKDIKYNRTNHRTCEVSITRCLHLLTKLSQSCHVVYHIQPIVMAFTPHNLWYIPCYWDSA